MRDRSSESGQALVGTLVIMVLVFAMAGSIALAASSLLDEQGAHRTAIANDLRGEDAVSKMVAQVAGRGAQKGGRCAPPEVTRNVLGDGFVSEAQCMRIDDVASAEMGSIVLSWTPGCGSGPVPSNLGKHLWLFFNAGAGAGLMSWVDQKTSCDSKTLRRTPCAYSSSAALAQVAMDCQLESFSNPVVHVASRLRSPVAIRYAKSLVSTGDGDGDGNGNGGGGGGGGNAGQPDSAGSLYQLAATTGLGGGLAYEEATVFVSRDGATTKLLAQGTLS